MPVSLSILHDDPESKVGDAIAVTGKTERASSREEYHFARETIVRNKDRLSPIWARNCSPTSIPARPFTATPKGRGRSIWSLATAICWRIATRSWRQGGPKAWVEFLEREIAKRKQSGRRRQGGRAALNRARLSRSARCLALRLCGGASGAPPRAPRTRARCIELWKQQLAKRRRSRGGASRPARFSPQPMRAIHCCRSRAASQEWHLLRAGHRDEALQMMTADLTLPDGPCQRRRAPPGARLDDAARSGASRHRFAGFLSASRSRIRKRLERTAAKRGRRRRGPLWKAVELQADRLCQIGGI